MTGDKPIKDPTDLELADAVWNPIASTLDWPLRWRNPQRILVCAQEDLFHENASDAWIDRVFAAMALASWHKFIVSTKCVIRMRKYFEPKVPDGWRARVGAIVAEHNADHHSLSRLRPRGESWLDQNWRRQHLWLGTFVEEQAQWWRVAYLLLEDAALHFLRCEPILGPLDLTAPVKDDQLRGQGDAFSGWWSELGDLWPIGKLDWVIISGEGGPGARPCDLAQIAMIVNDCRQHKVPVFIKRLGKHPWFIDPKGEDPAEWPQHLRVRQFPPFDTSEPKVMD